MLEVQEGWEGLRALYDDAWASLSNKYAFPGLVVV